MRALCTVRFLALRCRRARQAPSRSMNASDTGVLDDPGGPGRSASAVPRQKQDGRPERARRPQQRVGAPSAALMRCFSIMLRLDAPAARQRAHHASCNRAQQRSCHPAFALVGQQAPRTIMHVKASKQQQARCSARFQPAKESSRHITPPRVRPPARPRAPGCASAAAAPAPAAGQSPRALSGAARPAPRS